MVGDPEIIADFSMDLLTAITVIGICILLMDIADKLFNESESNEIFSFLLSWAMITVSCILSKHFEVSDLTFGDVFAVIFIGITDSDLLRLIYYVTSAVMYVIPCILLVFCNSNYEDLIFSGAPIVMISLYFLAFSNFGNYEMWVAWIIPFAYILIFNTAFTIRMKANFTRKMKLDMILLGISLVATVSFYQICSYHDVERFMPFFEDTVILIKLGYSCYYLVSCLFEFYAGYIQSRKHFRRLSKGGEIEDAKAIGYFLGSFLGLYLIETVIVMITTKISIFYFLVLVYGYSSLLMIGHAVYHGQSTIFVAKYELLNYAQVLLIMYYWRYLCF